MNLSDRQRLVLVLVLVHVLVPVILRVVPTRLRNALGRASQPGVRSG
jgi:hypothetical protein